MPKPGMEPLRRDALIRATIAEIGRQRALRASVGRRAARAHRRAAKDRIFPAAMRCNPRDFSASVGSRSAGASG